MKEYHDGDDLPDRKESQDDLLGDRYNDDDDYDLPDTIREGR